MGNYRFRFSDMIPNAWFYKLKDMSKTRKHQSSQTMKKKPPTPNSTPKMPPNPHQPRHSYYFTAEPPRDHDVFYRSPLQAKLSSDTHFPEAPRRSSRRRAKRKTIYKPSPRAVSSGSCRCRHPTLNSAWTKSILTQSPDNSLSPFESSPDEPESLLSEPDGDHDFFAAPKSPNDDHQHQLPSYSNSYNCELSSSTTDIIIDVNNESQTGKFVKIDGFDTISEIELPPILTKPAKYNDNSSHKTNEATEFKGLSKLDEIKARRSVSVKHVKDEESIKAQGPKTTSPLARKPLANSTGIKLRANSPRIASKKIQACARKSTSSNTCLKSRNRSLAESFVVVKSSFDPQRDFRESMMEMVVEKNIRTSKDLEDLLACYLSLNSREYHDLIVKAFEQIWFDMTNLRL